MIINVLNTRFEKVAVVDEFNSLMWCVRYNNIGALDLEVSATTQNLLIFRKGFYITRNDDSHIFRIEAIEINTSEDGNNTLLVGGLDLISILNQRVITNNVSLNQDLKTYVQKLIDNECSGDRYLSYPIEIETTENTITHRETTNSYVGDELFKVCKNEDLFCHLYFDNGVFKLVISKIKDRTIAQTQNTKIVFSSENDNLISSKYAVNTIDYKNAVYVHEKESLVNGVFVGEAKGLERREKVIESKGDSDMTYEGEQVLLDSNITSSFESEIDNNYYRYKTDYDIGDIITIQNEFGISANARITEIIETWDKEGYSLEPIFEIEEEINIANALLTEDTEAMLTENVELLLIETSPIVLEDETQYIITENGLQINVE